MQKSAVVLVGSKKRHPLYKKIYLRTKKYIVDDPKGVKEGDLVEIVKTRPVSKHKHFQVSRVMGTDIVSIETAGLQERAEEAIAQVMPEEQEKAKEEALSVKPSLSARFDEASARRAGRGEGEREEKVKIQKAKVKGASKKSKVKEEKGQV